MSEKPRILLVEDNDFVRMQIARFLTAADDGGYEVVEASDGKEAIEKINDNIAMAIVDVRMEPISGLEFIRHIRSEDNDTPVVLVTGDHNPDLLSEASKWDVAAVLMKPVER
ncbi:MAG: response regulator, partial [Bdellovibrionales bacterium]